MTPSFLINALRGEDFSTDVIHMTIAALRRLDALETVARLAAIAVAAPTERSRLALSQALAALAEVT